MVLDGCPIYATANVGYLPREAGLVVCSRARVLDRRSMRSFVLPIQGNEGTRFIAGRSTASPSIATWQKIRFGWDGIENVFDRWDLTCIRLRHHWVPHGEGQACRSRPAGRV